MTISVDPVGARWRRHTTVAIGLCLVATLVGCSSNQDDTGTDSGTSPDVQTQIAEHTWLLDRGASSLTVQNEQPITLQVKEPGTVSGSGACNTYFGDFSIDGSTVSVGPISATERGCPGNALAADAEYFAALEAVTSVTLNDGQLRLAGDASTLTFNPQDTQNTQADPVGTWTVTSVNKDGTTTATLTPAPTLTIEAEGNIGIQGCNSMGSTWTMDEDQFTVDENIASTLIGCPPDLAAQDEVLAQALQDVTQVTVAGTQLTMLDADDTTLLTALRKDR